jgi:hypothetical protein
MAVAAISASAVAGSLWAAAPAHASPVASGTLAFSGDPGDYITQGLSYSYTAGTDALNVSSSGNGSTVSLNVNGANGDWWFLDLDAPGGDVLAPGTYADATRYPFNDAGAGLDLFGNGRGCNTLTGSFTIDTIVLGPNGYVQTLDATFEQHCEGGEPAARGEVHVANPPPPPALELAQVVDAQGEFSSLNGSATVHGTVTCNKPASLTVSGSVVQVSQRTLARGNYSTQVNCAPESPGVWSARVDPLGDVPFRKGDSEVQTHVNGFDSDYFVPVNLDATTVVGLRRPRQ